uniref:Uncharacterized protein n=1 Tax=Candidatus Kentrum sp. FM TaxID=2126340 RepID=A0A450WDL6_9GAMM|nr:MAG: hypothetical protein BECKFM1743B_GA0114221_103511 [Candidatus Kentron sp. FM]
MADPCNYPSEIDMDGRMSGGEHLGSPLRSPERRGRILYSPIMPDSPSEAVKKSPGRSEAVLKRDWQGAKVPKSGSVASYMTPNHDEPWCFCNAASRDLGAAAVGRGFFHSLSGDFCQRTYQLACPFAQLVRCNDSYIVHYAPVIAP